jgi:hypothetical protein
LRPGLEQAERLRDVELTVREFGAERRPTAVDASNATRRRRAVYIGSDRRAATAAGDLFAKSGRRTSMSSNVIVAARCRENSNCRRRWPPKSTITPAGEGPQWHVHRTSD